MILLVNDDGIASPGLRALYRALPVAERPKFFRHGIPDLAGSVQLRRAMEDGADSDVICDLWHEEKEQFLRRLNERSAVRALARMEAGVLRDSEALRIGPMGLGGGPTLLAVKIGALSRLPACFHVTVSYMCWAFRRRGAVFGPEGGVHRMPPQHRHAQMQRFALIVQVKANAI